jgi:hypothetical protein
MVAPFGASQKPFLGGMGFNLAAITLAMALGGLALAYALDGAGRHHRDAALAVAPGTVVRTIAGNELTIPRALLRYDEPAASALTEEIDLRLELPLGPRASSRPIDVMLIPRSKARPSSALLDGVYLHQFTLEEVSGPPGLVGKPLQGKDGFEGETVWYDALSPNPFVAKCEAVVPGGNAARCIRTVYFDAVAAVYAFDSDVLGSWRAFDTEAEAVLKSIGIHRSRR